MIDRCEHGAPSWACTAAARREQEAALDRAQAIIHEQGRKLLDAKAEIEQLRRAGKSAMDLYGTAVIERDDAAGRLAEIRAECLRVAALYRGGMDANSLAEWVLAILDQEPAAD